MSNHEIIELVNIIAERPCDSEDCAPCIRMGRRCNDYLKAERVIQAGYRKQSEAEWIEAHGKTYIPLEYDENGYLILHDYTAYVCSACGRAEPKREPYCNCGAKMKGGAE